MRLFIGCILAIVATSFGFIIRALILKDWGVQFNLDETQKGALQGAGLFPFALSIILFSLIADKIGYGRSMIFAWVGHVLSAIITITATSYTGLYIGTLIFALANGVVEAVVNPVTATLFSKNKTHYLNILHAGWPGGLVLGGLLTIALTGLGWQWKIGLVLIPTAVYGLMLLGRQFPVHERVAAGVSYMDMLREFGWAGCFIVSVFAAMALDEILRVFGVSLGVPVMAIIAIVPTVLFALKVPSFGRPLFVFLLLVMVLLATTELGVDSWIADLMTPVLAQFGTNAGSWVLVYTSAIMFGLRFFAGPIVHRISPLGLLAACSLIAASGLYFLSAAGSAPAMVFLAATMYGVGKSFFWPTTLGVVSEQFPRGGALTMNAIAGVGMIAVGVLGAPFLGTLQDRDLDRNLATANSTLHTRVVEPARSKYGMTYRPVDNKKIEALPKDQQQAVEAVRATTKQAVLAKFAILPVIMFFCYLGIIFYFKSKGGYRPVELTGEQASGGIQAPVQA